MKGKPVDRPRSGLARETERKRALLDRITVVLVEPQGPRNVGGVARAMQNFGLSHLRIQGGIAKNHKEALDWAVSAKAILERAVQVPTFDEALDGMTFVVGTTSKQRYRLPTVRPKDAAPRVLEEAARGQVALLFGREDHGLTAAELGRAHAVMSIETAPECRALNLSHALTILAYEIFVASGVKGIVAHSDRGKVVTDGMRRQLKVEFDRALTTLGILKEGNQNQLGPSVDRILALGPMQTRDARVLFTLARKVVERLPPET